jgi:hypothetical protein
MIELDNNAYSDYEGPFRCWVCGGMQLIKTEEGLVRSMMEVQSCAAETYVGIRSGDGQPAADR